MESRCTPSHFLISETIEFDPYLRYLPVMITRLLLSIRKANALQERGWSLGESTTHTTIRFVERRGGGTPVDAIYLDTLLSTHEGAQSQERLDGLKDVTGRSGDLTPT